MRDGPAVREMRLVVTASNYAEAVHFYRDVLGLPERASYSSDPAGLCSTAGSALTSISSALPAALLLRRSTK